MIFFKRNNDIKHHETRSAAKLHRLKFKTGNYGKYYVRYMGADKWNSTIETLEKGVEYV